MLNHKTTLHGLIAPLALLFAGGCASYEWHKDGTSAAETQQLLAQCSAQARAEAARHPSAAAAVPNLTVDGQGRVIATQPQRNDSERLLLEQNMTRRCMTANGHTLRRSDASPP